MVNRRARRDADPPRGGRPWWDRATLDAAGVDLWWVARPGLMQSAPPRRADIIMDDGPMLVSEERA